MHLTKNIHAFATDLDKAFAKIPHIYYEEESIQYLSSLESPFNTYRPIRKTIKSLHIE